MIAIGAGGLDVALAMAGRPFRMTYPKVIGIRLSGKLSPWVEAKDVILKVLETLTTKGNVGCCVEYFGDGVSTLSVPERATITNMGAELGVTFSLFPSDKSTKAFLKAQGRDDAWIKLVPSAKAEYDRVIDIDLGSLAPMASCPSSPDNVKTINELEGKKVSQVVIGSCTNSSLRDLTLVARMLEGKRVYDGVSLAIAPGSRQVLETLSRNGDLAVLVAAGARILESACGACIGQGMSPANDAVSLRTFNRNFAGRTGTKGDQAYLVSPVVAATAALAGEIVDPRSSGIEYPSIKPQKKFLVNDNMIIRPLPLHEAARVEIIRKPTIGEPPRNKPLPERLDGLVLIKTGDKITTDHIMPAGVHLKHRSNIPVYAKCVFECFNEAGKPTFAERAAAARDSGRHGVIVGRESYGQGSSREHAAICPMFLGVKAVVAVTIERIHAANLVNFGIIPLVFDNPADYDKIQDGGTFLVEDIRGQLKPGGKIEVKLSGGKTILLRHTLNAEDIAIILAGGVLNIK